MIFIDTNVFIYAVGKPHPLRDRAREILLDLMDAKPSAPCTSAEVMQELMHVYLPVGRVADLDATFTIVQDLVDEVWAVEAEDILLARDLLNNHSGLSARDLIHLACCKRRAVDQISTFDRGLAAAFGTDIASH